MADSSSSSRAQRAAALEERKRRLAALREQRNRREEDSATRRSTNLDEYIDGLLNSTSSQQSAEEVKDEETLAVERTDSQNDSSKLPAESNASQETQVQEQPQLQPVPLRKAVETFAISTQTEPDDFPEKEEVDEEVEADVEEKVIVNNEEKPPEKDENGNQSKILTPEEVEKAISSPDFSTFINTSSKKVERLLGAPILSDLLVDTVGDTVREAATEATDNSKFLSSKHTYECSRWTATRDVTDLDWSPLHRELFLSTYSSNSSGQYHTVPAPAKDVLSSSLTPRSGELQSDGLALVWSLAMPNRPEHVMTCGSPVSTGRFHPTESTLILGGCQSGQLVIWDVRAGRLPVQKSSFKAKGHLHPIVGMEIIEGGSGLVTASTDGRVNFWSLANLRDPAESLSIGDSASSFVVAPESESLLLADEHGGMYAVTSGRSRKLRPLETNGAGHYGMVSALSSKRKGSSVSGLSKGFLRGSGGLILSAGVDWTVQLWAPAYADTPLQSWVSHSYDYMSDVQWSPVHPSLFATASSNGSVGLWNLAVSFDEPLTGQDGILLDSDAGCNKLKWSLDGRRFAVASSDKIHVLGIAEEVARPKGEEDNKIMSQLLSRGLIDRQ